MYLVKKQMIMIKKMENISFDYGLKSMTIYKILIN